MQTNLLHNKILQQSGLQSSFRDILQKCSKQLPTLERDRLDLYYALQTKTIRLDMCNFTTSMLNIHILSSTEKTSSTDSLLMFAEIELYELHPIPVAVKMVFKNLDDKFVNDSLQVERHIYDTIVNSLIMCGFTPHVVIYFGKIYCNHFQRILSDEVAKGNFAMEEIQEYLYDSDILPRPQQEDEEQEEDDNEEIEKDTMNFNVDKMRALILERVDGNNFQQMLTAYRPRVFSAGKSTFLNLHLPILFQVFYTLAVFKDVGLLHNDLHAGNVRIATFEKPVEYYYRVHNKLYRIYSKYQARIFDYDHGAKVPTKYNALELQNSNLSSYFCKALGECHIIDERREIFTFCYFSYLFNDSQNVYLKNFLQKIVPVELLKRKHKEFTTDTIPGTTLAWPGRLCACKDKVCDECVSINNSGIKSLQEILNMPEFVSNFAVEKLPTPNTFVWTLPSEG